MVEIMPINQLVNHLLHTPALAIEGSQAPGVQSLNVRDVHPRAAVIARGTGRERDELQPRVPGAPAQPNGSALLQPAPLLPGEARQARADTGGAGNAEDE